MKFLKFTALAVLMVFGTAVAQEVEKKMELKVIVDGNSTGEHDSFTWTSDDVDLDELAIGETRTLSGESGRDVTVTRTESGMEFNIDGETIVMPDMGAHGTTMAFVDADGVHSMDGDIDVEVISMSGEHETVDVKVIGGGAHATRVHAPDGIMIISETTLTDSVKDSIRSVLISAGHNDEVRFIDDSDDGPHVQVIKKRVEIQQ